MSAGTSTPLSAGSALTARPETPEEEVAWFWFQRIFEPFWHYRFSTYHDRSERRLRGARLNRYVYGKTVENGTNFYGDWGQSMELLARESHRNLVGPAKTTDILGYGMMEAMLPTPRPCKAHHLDRTSITPLLWSTRDLREVHKSAKVLMKLVRKNTCKVGSPRFMRALKREIERLQRLPSVTPHLLELDLADDGVWLGLGEYKSSGIVGDQKIRPHIERHLIRILACSRLDMPFHFIIGSERASDGGNRNDWAAYVENSHLLVDDVFWSYLFPDIDNERLWDLIESCSAAVYDEMSSSHGSPSPPKDPPFATSA